MNNSFDPIAELRGVREHVPAATAEMEARARRAMFAPPLPRRRRVTWATAGVFAVLALGIVVSTTPWAQTQSAAAAVDQLAEVAADQPPLMLGKNDWLITKYSTRTSWTQNFTQEKLDALSANAAAVMAAANGDGHYSRVDDAEQKKIDGMNARRLARVRAGVKIEDLPATHIDAWNEAPYESALNSNGVGGGGGGSNQVHYGSPEQKRASVILQRAGIGGLLANPTDQGAFEAAALPMSGAAHSKEIAGLSDDPVRMRAQLAGWKQRGAVDAEPGSALDAFAKAAGVVGSPYALPDQRAAAIRMIGSLPGVVVEQSARDAKGREGIGMALPIPGGTMQFVFDESSSRLLGTVIRVDDPTAFQGESYAGSGKDRVNVIPLYDSAEIRVSFEPTEVKRDGPPCTPQLCIGGKAP